MDIASDLRYLLLNLRLNRKDALVALRKVMLHSVNMALAARKYAHDCLKLCLVQSAIQHFFVIVLGYLFLDPEVEELFKLFVIDFVHDLLELLRYELRCLLYQNCISIIFI